MGTLRPEQGIGFVNIINGKLSSKWQRGRLELSNHRSDRVSVEQSNERWKMESAVRGKDSP